MCLASLCSGLALGQRQAGGGARYRRALRRHLPGSAWRGVRTTAAVGRRRQHHGPSRARPRGRRPRTLPGCGADLHGRHRRHRRGRGRLAAGASAAGSEPRRCPPTALPASTAPDLIAHAMRSSSMRGNPIDLTAGNWKESWNRLNNLNRFRDSGRFRTVEDPGNRPGAAVGEAPRLQPGQPNRERFRGPHRSGDTR